jgi:hypothetical protein
MATKRYSAWRSAFGASPSQFDWVVEDSRGGKGRRLKYRGTMISAQRKAAALNRIEDLYRARRRARRRMTHERSR